ncbi:MAG: ribonuclease P protein component [bacterium]|nr:MAG: ribonuclease P protein component [bacterium]
MLPSRNRLKKKVNFARIEIDGKMYQSTSFGMGSYFRDDNEESCFGFIISTKISKKAVVRNRIKRIMSEVVRQKLPTLKKGYDVVFLIKPAVLRADKKDLEREVNEVIIKNI